MRPRKVFHHDTFYAIERARHLLGITTEKSDESEKQEMYADLRMYEFYSKKSLSLDNTVRYYCDFEDDFLGIDRLLEEEIRALQVQSGSEDHEEIIRAVHPEWDDMKVTETVKKIQAMKKEKSKPAKGGPSRSGEARAGDQA